MYTAILLRTDQGSVLDEIEEKVIIHLPRGNYTLYTTLQDNLPETIRSQLVKIVYDTGIRSPIRADQHYHWNLEDLSTGGDGSVPSLDGVTITWPEVSRHLMAVKSKLVYALTSQLSSDGLYFSLSNQPNSVGTQREFLYELRFNQITCFGFGPQLSEEFSRAVRELNVGPLLVSTYTLDILSPTGEKYPRWLIREHLRDLIDTNAIADIVSVSANDLRGSDEIYIFKPNPVNLTDDVVEEFIELVRGQIVAALRTNTFPKGTPTRLVQAKRLRKMSNNQYFIPYPMPATVNPWLDRNKVSFNFRDANQLFRFLTALSGESTYDFIRSELQIEVHESHIRMVHITEYLPDHIRVLRAAQEANRTDVLVGDGIPFWDSYNNRWLTVTSENITNVSDEPSPLKRLSLDRRMAVDTKF